VTNRTSEAMDRRVKKMDRTTKATDGNTWCWSNIENS